MPGSNANANASGTHGNADEQEGGSAAVDDLDLGDGWAEPSSEGVSHAVDAALSALAAPTLHCYYDRLGNYAGASFASMGSNPAHDLVPDDLLAVTTLSVSIGPRVIRGLLEPGEHRSRVLGALEEVSESVCLADASAHELLKASAFHDAVLEAIKDPDVGTSNPWVTASKITARKRPHLIPVRDNVIGKLLGHGAVQSRSVYWRTLRLVLKEPSIQVALTDTREALRRQHGDIVVDPSDLRLLDAALWFSKQRRSLRVHA